MVLVMNEHYDEVVRERGVHLPLRAPHLIHRLVSRQIRQGAVKIEIVSGTTPHYALRCTRQRLQHGTKVPCFFTGQR